MQIVCLMSQICLTNMEEKVVKKKEIEKVLGKSTDEYKYCNHHHELDENHEVVDFGDGEFVSNKKAIPLLKALNELGIRTRTHHIDEGSGFFSILLDNVIIEKREVHENVSTRTRYNGKKELLITFKQRK